AWQSLPWLVMGAGVLVGGVPSVTHFVRPAVGGPFVRAFWVVVYGWICLTGYWGIRGGGAEILARHPGLLNVRTSSVRRLKWHFGGLVVFGLFTNTAALLMGIR